MKICITGASGFLGAWTSHLLSQDYEIFAVTRKDSSTHNLSTEPRVNIISEEGDNWSALINDLNPEILIMLDWKGVGNQERNSQEQYENVLRVEKFIKALRPLNQIIGVGSQAELGAQLEKLTEESPENPTTEYGRAKNATRRMLFDHFRYSKTNFKWARIFSTYGAMDSGDWLIPNLIRSLNQDKPFELTEGIQKWSYLHAYDAAMGFKYMMHHGDSGIYNLGNPNTNLIREVCLEIAEKMNKNIELLKFGSIPMRIDQVYQMDLSAKKLMELGWEPQVGLSEGLTHTIEWILGKQPNLLELKNGLTYNLKN